MSSSNSIIKIAKDYSSLYDRRLMFIILKKHIAGRRSFSENCKHNKQDKLKIKSETRERYCMNEKHTPSKTNTSTPRTF